MRRKDREITDASEILRVIENNKVLRIAMSDKDKPYIVPLNYGYTFKGNRLTFYFHCAKEGKKLDILKGNNNICFEIDSGHCLVMGDSDCNCGYLYESVIGEGKFYIINEEDEQDFALTQLMNHQTNQKREYRFKMKNLVYICKLEISNFTAKSRKI